MGKIIKQNGNVYLVEGEKGFETFYRLGKDEEYWNKLNEKKKKIVKREETFIKKENTVENIEPINEETKKEEDI